MAVPTDSAVTGNLLFPLIMIALTLAAVVVTVYHPIAWSDDEMRLAVGGPAALGHPHRARRDRRWAGADARSSLGPLDHPAADAGLRARRRWACSRTPRSRSRRATGSGPMARHAVPYRGRARAAARGRRRPRAGCASGSGLGLPIVWMVVCLLGIPLAVYVALYLPWAFSTTTSSSPAGRPGTRGQTLVDLTGADVPLPQRPDRGARRELAVVGVAAQPQARLVLPGLVRDSTAASIYDAGNMVIWWLGIPAMAFVAYQAFRRRSLALALILDRLPRASGSAGRASTGRRSSTTTTRACRSWSWRSATSWPSCGTGRRAGRGCSRGSPAAVALMGPVILWLLRRPLCAIAGVDVGERGLAGLPTAPPATSS